jgi:NRPS condensation-like uncharacterized protein
VTRPTPVYSLSYNQQRLWFLNQLQPGNPAYNIPIARSLAGPLDTAALEKSLNEIARRHAILRASFAAVDGQTVQTIHPPQAIRLPTVDLSAMAEGERQAELQRVMQAESQRPFDLSQGPLFRAMLVRLQEVDHVLLLTLHHIVSDGWSMGVLMRELLTLYEAFTNGRPSPLPNLPMQYGDYAAWQRQWLQGEVLEQQLNYWKGQLADAPPGLKWPAVPARPNVQSKQSAQAAFDLDETMTARLKKVSQQADATLFMTLLAAFNMLLGRHTQQEDILVGTTVANRHREDTQGLIGPFENTLVLRSR